MDAEERTKLVAAMIELYTVDRNSERYDDLFWSYMKLADLRTKDPETAWEIILEIMRADDSRAVFSVLAAGPLESLLAEHGPSFIDRIEHLAAQDATFRCLLGGVWQNAMTEEIWQRVQRSASEPGPAERQALAKTWINLQKVPRPSAEYDEHFWIDRELNHLIHDVPEIGWKVILEILETDQRSIVFVNLATGPLMELLGEAAPDFIERVEFEAAANPAFRKMLAGTWQGGMSDDVWKRVQECWDARGWEEITGRSS